MTEEQEQVQEEITNEEMTPETKTYTQEELDAYVSALKEESKQEAWKQYQGLQTKYNKLYEENKRLSTQTTPQSGVNPELLEVMKSQADGDPEQLERIRRLGIQLEQEKQSLAQKQRQQMIEEENTDQRKQLDDKIREAGFDPTDDMFVDVDESFVNASMITGNFDIVHRKLDRVLKSVKKPEVESEERKKERAKREQEEQGNLRSPERIAPSAISKRIPNKREDLNDFIKGLTDEEYAEMRPKIDEAMRSGKL